MKKLLLLLAILPFTISCNGQNIIETNEFVKSTDLKGKIWHTGLTHGDIQIGNGFSNQIFLYFLDKDSIQLKYYQYSPSIGGRTSIINGTYKVDNKNEVSIIFTEPTNASGALKISISGKDVQYSLYSISSVRINEVSQPDLTELPQIKTYRFKIIEQLDNNNIITEVTLFDNEGAKYSFGKYKFDTNKEITKED